MADPLRMQDVQRTYRSEAGDLPVLRGVDLTLAAGEIVALVAPSGAGKSTLLHIAGLLDKPDGGAILLAGRDAGALSDAARTAIRRDTIGFVYQMHHLLAEFTALENVTLPLEILGWNLTEAVIRSKELLREIGMEDRGNHFPRQLSGGEQQRIAIARAYVHNPEIVFADEPTGSLDRETAEKVLENLLRFQAGKNAALVLVTHDLTVASRMGRALSLERGHIVHERR